jgi:hypothetical protein
MLAVPGMSLTVNTLEGERVQVSFVGSFRTSGASANNDLAIGYQVDSDTPVPGGYSANNTTESSNCSFTTLTDPLSAGQHTIKLVASSSTGTDPDLLGYNGLSDGTDCRFQVIRTKSFGIGAGTILNSGSGYDNAAFTAGSPTTIDSVAFTTAFDNEVVFFSWYAWGSRLSGGVGGDSMYFYYQLDADPDTFIHSVKSPNTYSDRTLGFAFPITIPTAGTHTINLKGAVSGGSWRIYSGSSGTNENTLYVTQFRGGIIPIKDEGVEIVEKPSALNFVGALVEADGTEAKVTFPNAALGGYQAIILDDLGANETNTNTSYAALTGISQQTFTTPVNGPHMFRFRTTGNMSGGTLLAHFRIVIDKGLASEVIVGDSDQWGRHLSVNDSYEAIDFEGLVDLAAGEHTADFEIKVSANTFNRTSNNPATCSVTALGSGINGLEVQEVALASDFTVTQAYSAVPGAGMAPITGLTLTFNTLENEYVELNFNGVVELPAASAQDLILGYDIDAGTPIVAVNLWDDKNDAIGFRKMIGPLSAGSHTVRITASSSGGAADPIIKGAALTANTTMQIVRYKVLNVGAAEQYVDRGDPSGYDFAVGSFTVDNAWHDLDLSSIVPAEAAGKRVFFLVLAAKTGGSGSQALAFRTKGQTNPYDQDGISIIDDTIVHRGSFWVECDSNREIQYLVTGSAWSSINFVVRGWMVPGGGIEIPIQEEGSNILTAPSAINFVGAGATVTDVGGVATVTVPGGGGSSIEVDDEGTPLTTAVTKFDFAGAGVTVTEPVADEVLVTIPGGGASTFTDLTDTPANYTSQGNKLVAVNSGETALEFITAPSGNFLLVIS